MADGNERGVERLTGRDVSRWLADPNAMKPGTKLADGGGLYLVRLPSGSASWQVRYKISTTDKWPKMFSIGPASSNTIDHARAERRRVKESVKQGVDPIQSALVKRIAVVSEGGELFRHAAATWFKKKKPRWSEVHYRKATQAFERDVSPIIGDVPWRQITPAMISTIVEKIQTRKNRKGTAVRETASRVLQHIVSVYRLAAAKSEGTYSNPAEAAIEMLMEPEDVIHHPALLEWSELREVLRVNETTRIDPALRMMHRLIAFTAVRIANAVALKPSELHLDAKPAEWVLPRKQMKVKKGRTHPHKIILCPQIVAELRRWLNLLPEDAEYVFPSVRRRKGPNHISIEALEKAMRRTMGLADKHSPHGWRSSFSTRAMEDGGFDKEVVDFALDHIQDSSVARAYDRGLRLRKRIELMTWWGNALYKAERGIEVPSFKRKRAA